MLLFIVALAGLLSTEPLRGDSVTLIDLADLTPGPDPLTRLLGPDRDSVSLGNLGVPVAAGGDLDGDGFQDLAIGHFRKSPLGRDQAGQVSIVFGNGTVGEEIDLQGTDSRILRIFGAGAEGAREMTGSEVWMADVTGDGVFDLLICRQNFSQPGRDGAGALTILVGGPELRDLADAGDSIDLAAPPATVTLFTLVGRHSYARLGIWTRVGDVDGDLVTDFVVGADQEDPSGTHAGACYVVRGGIHLDSNETVDLDDFGSTTIEGHLARIVPPNGSFEYHFGATCQMGDLDGNGRVEVMAAAALNRAGASTGPFFGSHGSGGSSNGTLYVVWDDAFPLAPWPSGLEIDLETIPAASLTTIDGDPSENDSFGEEILGGLDYSGDGNAELFIGDLVGDGFGGTLFNAGLGYVIYDAATIKGLSFSIDSPPVGVEVTKIIGPNPGAIGSDTAGHGDFNGDGFDDLMIGNPHAQPLGRNRAGSMTILLGQSTPWPAIIDTAPGVITAGVDIVEVQGRFGDGPGDIGDTLCYSASIGDLDNDGIDDLVVNEMLGNGTSPDAIDSGNLIVVPGSLIITATTTVAEFSRGDANADGSFNIADAIAILDYVFFGSFASCLSAYDANDDGGLDIGDAVYGLSTLFSGGSPPPAPYPGCGADPTPDSLNCTTFAGC